MNSKLRIAVSTLFFLLVIGTLFYHFVEKWSYIDSFYFTSITLTTIGYGDLYATTPASRLFTAAFAIIGVSVALYSLTIIGSDYFAKREAELLSGLKSPNDNTSILKGNADILRADKHVIELLKKLDERIRK